MNVDRRRQVAAAGHTGDEATARDALTDGDPSVRATALAALQRLGAATSEEVSLLVVDESPVARRRAAEIARHHREINLVPLLGDPDPGVIEAAAWALGEREEATEAVVTALAGVAMSHDDPLCREAAVAALGAIGDEHGLPAILAATTDKPAIRRRAVIALAPFEGPEVDAALTRALKDRDWQVRQAAEDLLAED